MLVIKNENINFESSEMLENEPLFKKIVAQIEDGTFKLSFTKMNNFLTSPRAFMQYCMKTQERTKAMKYGSMLHHWLLEKSTFDDNYKVAPDVNLTTTVGKETYTQFLVDLIGESDFRLFLEQWKERQEHANDIVLSKFKPTKTKTEPEFKNVWTYKDLQEFVENEKCIEIVRDNDMVKAKKQADAIINDYDFRKYIYPKIEYTERLVKNHIDGYDWTGKIDIGGKGMKADIKTVTDADPQILQYSIPRDFKHVQGLIYNKLDETDDEFYNVSVDGNFQTSVVKISDMRMLNAEHIYQRFLDGFIRCIMSRSWWESYSFWNERIFEI